MFATAAQVRQDVLVSATGFFQRIGQDAEAGVVERAGGEDAVIVGGLSEAENDTIVPCQSDGGDGDGMEEIAEEVAEHLALR
jgi:hypothetical protein